MDPITTHAKVLWDYLQLNQTVTPMDAICALGSDSTRVAEYAADLWRRGLGKYLIVSGGQASRSSSGKTEGEIYADIALSRGVPEDRVIVEPRATNTGENILFIKELLSVSGHNFHSFLLVQKPYMERRVYATFRKIWPEAECVVTSPPVTFQNYARDSASRDRLVVYLMSAFYRVREYPKCGFQIAQDIPIEVEDSYVTLLNFGYKPV